MLKTFSLALALSSINAVKLEQCCNSNAVKLEQCCNPKCDDQGDDDDNTTNSFVDELKELEEKLDIAPKPIESAL